MDKAILSLAANQARGLAIDAVHACNSGHLGLPLGSAEIGAVLFGHALRINPDEPRWINRDRFILSAGHGSMFLYGWLHLAGFDLPIEEIRNFRQLHSKTPGHPEFGETPGVEATTGPLGQGISNGVGFAVSGKMAAARFNTAEHTIFDQHVVILAGDGCLQEGVAAEAAAFAGHQQLDNLIVFYDSNDVTLDAMADTTQSADTCKRFEALGWDAVRIDGHDMDAVLAAFEKARADDNGRPKLIECKTEIARGIPEVAGTAGGHGEGGAKFAEAARKGLGLPEELFYVSGEVREYFARLKDERKAAYEEWASTFSAWKEANPQLAAQLESGLKMEAPGDLLERIPHFDPGYADATRGAGGVVIQAVAEAMPLLVSGSADLYGSTKNYIKSSGDFSPADRNGHNIRFGIREHAMGAICNGIAYDGIFRATGATFCVFADYMRPSIRLAALAGLPVGFIFTHDSVGVGEDGPTHQPVETVSGLRVIPNLDVIRPADPEEVAGAWAACMERIDGPTALILTRQKVPTLNDIPVNDRREGVFRGAYVAVRETAGLEVIFIATGSELHDAIVAAGRIGPGVRVVSMPCMERFDRQPEDYRESVLPRSCKKRVAMEAGVTGLWHKYVGPEGKILGIERFGLSAPCNTALTQLGITADAMAEAAIA